MESISERVVVVGSCATGKSTLVAALRAMGVNASVCAQEHSEIPTLWNHTQPDVLVLLEADLATVRRRRNNPNWSETIYRVQQRRLTNARAVADVVIDTARFSLEESLQMVTETLSARRHNAVSAER